MSRISRNTFNSGFFHVMMQGINKEYIFEKNENKNKYLHLIKKYYENYNIKLVAYCIMNNHAHFIIYTENISEISKYMQQVNSIYAKEYNRSENRVGYVFRDRYKSQYIYNREYLMKCIKYVHMNPVKAKIVNYEKEYDYSSYSDYINKKGFINDKIINLVFGNTENYLYLLNSIKNIDIEIIDVDNTKENFEIAIKNYINIKNITLEDIKKNKELLYDFSTFIIEKGYKQKMIAEKLEINTTKISLVLNDEKIKQKLCEKNENYPQ